MDANVQNPSVPAEPAHADAAGSSSWSPPGASVSDCRLSCLF